LEASNKATIREGSQPILRKLPVYEYFKKVNTKRGKRRFKKKKKVKK
jgi:hypothetical protein